LVSCVVSSCVDNSLRIRYDSLACFCHSRTLTLSHCTQSNTEDRTTSDYYAIILVFKATFEAVLIAFDALKDGLPDSYPYFWKVFVPGSLGAIVQSFDTVLQQVGHWCYVESQLDALHGR
jgi:hypothetical protein